MASSSLTITNDELKIASSPLDFVGINVYKPGWYIEPSDDAPGYHDIPVNASHPKMQSSRTAAAPPTPSPTTRTKDNRAMPTRAMAVPETR